MKYISVFSGIEAASVAWNNLGWEPVAFSEIEPFPCRVLQHHYPNVHNLGDITKINWSPYVGTVDLVVGGSPCQTFSIAGTQTGLDGASGLVREYFRGLEVVRPRFFLWENVPGALSSSRGNDFQFILRQWDKLGYHVAWRVLDAKYLGVAQRRRRVFAFGSLRDWRDPIKVLFERESLRRNTKPRKKKGEADTPVAGTGAEGTSRRVARMVGFGDYAEDGTASALKARDYNDCTDIVYSIQGNMIGCSDANGPRVRRLTPLECLRLQGFPDDYLDLDGATDTQKYKAIGNSMAVPVMRWIGERIEQLTKGA